VIDNSEYFERDRSTDNCNRAAAAGGAIAGESS
jgi:hypothetical protein